jgi:aldose 1-epimerase
MNAHLAGFNSTGYDNAFIIDRPINTGLEASNFPVLSLWSSATGIRMDLSTNRQGLQIYSCIGQNGTIPVKPSQVQRNNGIAGGGTKFVNQYGCIVIETQDWIDGINHPEWGRNDWQIFSAETGPAVNYATYDFSTF